MKVKIIASAMQDIEKKADEFFQQHPGIDLKSASMALWPSGEGAVVALFYEAPWLTEEKT